MFRFVLLYSFNFFTTIAKNMKNNNIKEYGTNLGMAFCLYGHIVSLLYP